MTPAARLAIETQRQAGAVAAESSAPEVTDLELVKWTREGQTEAFSELVRRHQQMTYNLAYRFMRDHTLAEDMAQEAFLKAFRLLDGFRGDSSFGTWLYRVTSSVCLTELNRRKRRGEVESKSVHLNQSTVESSQVSDLPEHLRRCVTELSDRYAEIVTLYYLNGISYDEIAATLNIPMGTLKTWMFRARKQLRAIVEKELYSDG